MMRFVCLVWDVSDPSASEAANVVTLRLRGAKGSWSPAFETPGLAVHCSAQLSDGPLATKLADKRGIVLGTLFESSRTSNNSPPVRPTHFGTKDTRAVALSHGRSLIKSHWGSYVLFLNAHDGRGAVVLRGPMTTIPCFVSRFHNVTVFFSEVEDYLMLRLGRASINWDCISAQSAGGDFLAEETGISEIAALSSGEAMEIKNESHVRNLYWSPAAITVDQIDDEVEAAMALRESTQLCVDSLVSNQKTVILQFSGGLDSSILLACLRKAPSRPHVIAVNFWNRQSGDERMFAESMARKTASELLVLERNPKLDLRGILDCARTATPVLHFSAYDIEPRLIRLAHERNGTSIFSGEYGDDIFGHARGPEILAEALNSYGIGQRFLSAAADYAELDRTSIWTAIRVAARYRKWQRLTPYWSYFRYKQFIGFGARHSLATAEAALAYERSLPRFIHPWLRDVRATPAGRAMLIYSLVTATSSLTHSPFGGVDSTMFVSPFASQPLVETFCKIPSRFHYRKAENGAVARAAFRNELSAEVMGRGTGKGSVDLWIQDLLPHNRTFLEDFLTDGILAKQGIIDKNKLQATLSGTVNKSGVGVAELIIHCYIEAWLRRWTGSDVRAAA